MSITSVLVIFLVICMALGPVLMLQPSKRQKRIASLRTEAAGLGIKVQLQKVDDETFTVYSLPWPTDSTRKYSGVGIYALKKDYEHGLHIRLYWDLQPRDLAKQETLALLDELIGCIPEGVVGVELTSAGLGLYWRERGVEGVLAVIHNRLQTYTAKFWPTVSDKKQV